MVRQTLGYLAPGFEERDVEPDPMLERRDVDIPGGTYRLGALRTTDYLSLIMKNGRTQLRLNRFVLPIRR